MLDGEGTLPVPGLIISTGFVARGILEGIEPRWKRLYVLSKSTSLPESGEVRLPGTAGNGPAALWDGLKFPKFKRIGAVVGAVVLVGTAASGYLRNRPGGQVEDPAGKAREGDSVRRAASAASIGGNAASGPQGLWPALAELATFGTTAEK